MRGICGIYNFKGNGSIEKSVIENMNRVLTHRGTDDEGIFLGFKSNDNKYKIALGRRRLSIIDLETGHQSIHNEDKMVWIVFNGEIYNFRQLRKNSQERGHKFYTKSDAETIIHLYEDYGIDCLKYLRGMFAFAIWDDRKKILFLATDRLGQNPLIYKLDNNKIIFASEIKAILRVPTVQRKVNLSAIHHYLTYQYVPSPHTAFLDIKKLPLARYLTMIIRIYYIMRD